MISEFDTCGFNQRGKTIKPNPKIFSLSVKDSKRLLFLLGEKAFNRRFNYPGSRLLGYKLTRNASPGLILFYFWDTGASFSKAFFFYRNVRKFEFSAGFQSELQIVKCKVAYATFA